MECPKRSLLLVGSNSLQTFGFNFAKCLTFHIRKTTAYHPESNGAVERLHRRLKDALRACAAAATWSEELPFVLLGLRAQPRGDTGLSLAEGVLVHKLSCQMNFCKITPVDSIVKIFSKTLHVSAPSRPRHNSSTDLPSELPAKLLSAPLLWVRRGSLVPPLQPLYDGPYAFLRRGPCSFTIRVGSRDKVVAVSRLKGTVPQDFLPTLFFMKHISLGP